MKTDAASCVHGSSRAEEGMVPGETKKKINWEIVP